MSAPADGKSSGRGPRSGALPVGDESPVGEFGQGEIFGDDAAAVGMVDRLIHHAELISLKGDSYRLKDRDLGPTPGRQTAEAA